MTVSCASWHYKVYRYWMNTVEEGPLVPFRGHRDDIRPTSLCAYFWAIVGLSVLLPLLGLAILAIGVAAAPFVGASLGVRWLYHKNVAWRRARRIAKYGFDGKPPKPPKEPGLLVQFAKARKQKLCPLIELVD